MTSLRTVVLLLGAGLLGIGVVVVAPSSTAPSRPTPDVAWTPPMEVASGAAVRGRWRMNESDWRFVDDPTVALTDDDTAHVVWAHHPRRDLFFQAYGPDGTPRLDSTTNVSQTPETFSWLPRMVTHPGAPDTLYVLWQEIIFSGGSHGGDILFARSTDGGRSFSDPRNLSRSPAGDGKGRLTAERWHNGSLDLAVDSSGTLYAAWTEYEGRLWLRRSPDGGRSFSSPVYVAGTDATPARAPTIALDTAGRVHLAWTVGETPDADIHYAQSDTSGRAFGTPRPVASSAGHADAPTLAIDSTGTIHLAYGERPDGPFRASHVRYTHAPPDSAFATPIVLSRRHAEAYDSAGFPSLRVGPDDTLYVLWELFPTVKGRPRALGFIASRAGGRTFSRPTVLPGSDNPAHGFNGSQQGLLMEKLAVNAHGRLAVVNSTFQPQTTSHIWLYRGHPTP